MTRWIFLSAFWAATATANPLAHLEKACSANDAAACHLAGTRYRFGLGVPKDPARGGRLLSRALELEEAGCKKGDAVSCFVAAESHRGPDDGQAVPLYERACRGGLRVACAELERLAEK